MRSVKVIVGCVAIGAASLSALGQNQAPQPAPQPAPPPGQPGDQPPPPRQPGGGRGQLSPEKAKAAWALQATAVAKHLGVEDAKVADVVKAYTAARESQEAAVEKLRSNPDASPGDAGGGARDMRRALEEANKAEREKLEKSLAAVIGADHAAKATASLGSFSRQWDTMADAIGEFKLEAPKQQEALNAVESYIAAQGKMREQVQSGDRDAVLKLMQESRQQLTDSLKKVLSEEQLKKFESSMGRGGRGGPGGGGPGGPGGPGGGGGGGSGGGGKDGGGK
ncbi:MAG: hypothetical protein IT435_04745 [Phycisphaerales bacterium]|nr:hypothetical protein [Phycisphaerales bacterium]